MSEEDQYQEIRALRERIEELSKPMSLEETAALIAGVVMEQPLTLSQVAELARAIRPIVSPAAIKDKVLLFEIPMVGTIDADMMQRYCAYVDFLKGMGAKGAIFVPAGVKVSELTDEELARSGLKRI